MNLQRNKTLARSAAALMGLYLAIAAMLLAMLPGRRDQFECMVIGTGAAGITVVALFFGILRKPNP